MHILCFCAQGTAAQLVEVMTVFRAYFADGTRPPEHVARVRTHNACHLSRSLPTCFPTMLMCCFFFPSLSFEISSVDVLQAPCRRLVSMSRCHISSLGCERLQSKPLQKRALPRCVRAYLMRGCCPWLAARAVTMQPLD
jgi:hypothetical protein